MNDTSIILTPFTLNHNATACHCEEPANVSLRGAKQYLESNPKHYATRQIEDSTQLNTLDSTQLNTLDSTQLKAEHS